MRVRQSPNLWGAQPRRSLGVRLNRYNSHCCSVVAHQLLIYKGIVSSEMVRRQILSAYEPRILGKGASHDQDPL